MSRATESGAAYWVILAVTVWFLLGVIFTQATSDGECVALAPATIETSRHYVADWTTLEARP